MIVKRRFIQIHLSTAIVLMFAAGGLLWANLTPRTVNMRVRTSSVRVVHGEVEACEWIRSADHLGWPLQFYVTPMTMVEVPSSNPPPPVESCMAPLDPDLNERMDRWPLAIDVASAILLLSIGAVVLEFHTRRGE